jgi:hypothetical protein
MSETALIVMGDKLTPALLPAFALARDQALEQAALVAVVRNDAEKRPAVEAQIAVKRLIDAVEKSRKAVKEPYLEASRLIDATAKAAVAELAAEQLRLAKIVGDWDMLQLAIARDREAARQEELRRIADQEAAEKRRIEAEARAAEDAREAETKRLADDAAKARGAKAKAEAEARQKAQQAEFAKQREAEAKNREVEFKRQQELAAQAVEAVGPEKAMAKSEGQRVTARWTFEVTDIWLLAKMHPGMVKIEPRTAEINQALAMGVRQISGCRVFEEIKSGVTTSGKKAIEI